MKNEKTNNRTTGASRKLLAAVAVFAMVAAAFAIVAVADSGDDVYAEETAPTEIKIAEFGEFSTKAAGSDGAYTYSGGVSASKAVKFTLTADIKGDLIINSGSAKVTIDLNGFKMTNTANDTIKVESGATVDIIDSSVAKTGTVDNVTHLKAALRNNGGTVTILGGTFERSADNGVAGANNEAVQSFNSYYTVNNVSGNMVIGTVGGDNDSVKMLNKGTASSVLSASAGSITINCGTFEGGRHTVNNDAETTLIIKDGVFTHKGYAIKSEEVSKYGYTGAIASEGTTTIDGGVFTSEYQYPFLVRNGELTINQATMNGKLGAFYIENDSNGSTVTVGDKVVLGDNPSITLDKKKTDNGTYTSQTVTLDFKVTGLKVQLTGAESQPATYITSVSKDGYVFKADSLIKGVVTFEGDKTAEVTLKAGASGLTFSKGSLVIEGTIITVHELASAIEGESDIVLKDVTIVASGGVSDNITFNNVTVKGNVSFGTGVDVTLEGTVTVDNGAKLTVKSDEVNNGGSGKIVNNGSVDIAAGTVGVDITNKGSVVVTNPEVTIEGDVSGTPVNTDSVSSEATISGEFRTADTIFSQYQVVTASGDVTIVSGAKLTFEGKFIIPEGVTLTIESGAKLVIKGQFGILENNGKIIVESEFDSASNGSFYVNGGKVLNNGSISVEIDSETEFGGDKETLVIAGQFENNGVLYIGDNSRVEILVADTVVNNADGKIVIDGALDFDTSGNIVNKGTFTVNGKVVASAASNDIIANEGLVVINGNFTGTIVLKKTSATVDVKLLAASSNLNINNTGLTSNKTLSGKDDNLNVVNDANKVIGGFVVGSRIVSTGTTTVAADLVISGSVYTDKSAANTGQSTANTLTFTNTVAVTDKFTVNPGVTFVNGTCLSVSGELKVLKDAVLKNESGKIVVTGTITLVDSDVTGSSKANVYAAKYTIRGELDANGVKAPDMNVYSTLENALASGVKKIDVKSETGYVIDKDFTVPAETELTFTATGLVKIKEGVTVTVAETGVIVITGTSGNIDVDGTLVLVNGKTGLNPKDNVDSEVQFVNDKSKTFTNLANALANAASGEEITLKAPEASLTKDAVIKEGVTLKIEAGKNVNLGNNMTLTIDGTLFLQDGGNYVIVPKDTDEDALAKIVLNGVVQSTTSMLDDAASYPAGAFYSITTSGRAMYYITPAEKAFPNINTFDGAKVTLCGEQTIGDVSIIGTTAAKVDVKDKLTAGTITAEKVTFTFDKAFIGTISNSVGSVAINALGDAPGVYTVKCADTLQVSGKILQTATSKEGVVFSGEVTTGASFETSKAVIDGNVKVDADAKFGNLTVNGTVSVKEAKTLSCDVLTIIGTVNADANNAKVSVTNNMYIGITKNDLSATAVATGDFTAGGITYVAAGSEAPDTIKALGSVVYKVNGAVWVTAYAANNTPVESSVKPVVENAVFDKWLVGTQPLTNFTTSAQVAEAKLITKIYQIEVLTDGGIGTVAIDGNVMRNNSGNVFELDYFLEAGDHTVSFKFKEGYEGKVVMSVNGTADSDLVFTTSGNTTIDGTSGEVIPVKFVLNLQGAEPMPPVEPIVPPAPVPPTPVPPAPVEPVDEGLTVTDYLLIVLVVLIAVMAIMVAMKLMRS